MSVPPLETLIWILTVFLEWFFVWRLEKSEKIAKKMRKLEIQICEPPYFVKTFGHRRKNPWFLSRVRSTTWIKRTLWWTSTDIVKNNFYCKITWSYFVNFGTFNCLLDFLWRGLYWTIERGILNEWTVLPGLAQTALAHDTFLVNFYGSLAEPPWWLSVLHARHGKFQSCFIVFVTECV